MKMGKRCKIDSKEVVCTWFNDRLDVGKQVVRREQAEKSHTRSFLSFTGHIALFNVENCHSMNTHWPGP